MVSSYFQYVKKLSFRERPNYTYCRDLFSNFLHKLGFSEGENLKLLSVENTKNKLLDEEDNKRK